MATVINIIAFPGLVIAWLVFGFVAMRTPEGLGGLWPRFRRWPLVVQLLAWVLLLPVVLAIWIARVLAADPAPAAGPRPGLGIALCHVSRSVGTRMPTHCIRGQGGTHHECA